MKKSLLLIVPAILASVIFSSAFAASKADYIPAWCSATYGYEGKQLQLSDVDFQFGYPQDSQLNFVNCHYGARMVVGAVYSNATAFVNGKDLIPGWKQENSHFADCATKGSPLDCQFLKKVA